MLDPNFRDRERQEKDQKQKEDVMKMLMGEMLDNPNVQHDDNMKKLLNHLDKHFQCDG
jgi:hypothetical protein